MSHFQEQKFERIPFIFAVSQGYKAQVKFNTHTHTHTCTDTHMHGCSDQHRQKVLLVKLPEVVDVLFI